jgi:hypothetical protein
VTRFKHRLSSAMAKDCWIESALKKRYTRRCATSKDERTRARACDDVNS